MICFPFLNNGSYCCLLNNAGSIIGSFFLALVAFVLYLAHRKNRIKEENQVKIEKFLADYEAFKPAGYSYADIERITNQFSDELGQGAYGTVYKGKLSDEVFVAVKVLNNSKGKSEEFINEVGIIGQIQNVNVVRLLDSAPTDLDVLSFTSSYLMALSRSSYLQWRPKEASSIGKR